MKILIRADYILTLDENDTIIENGEVLIEGDTIKAVGKGLNAEGVYVIDDRPSILLPGFINTHTHIAMVGFRGLADDRELMDWLQNYIWPAENRVVDEEFIKKAVPLALAEMISTGTTTFNDMYFFPHITAEITREAGLRGFISEGVINFPTPSARNSEEGLAIAEDFIKNWKGDRLIHPVMSLHAPYSCSRELIIKGYELARKYDVPLHMHVSETKAEVQQIKEQYGTTPVRFLNSLGVLFDKFIAAHSVWLEEEEIDIFAEKGVGVAHNPQSNMKLASGVAPIPDMLERGVKVGLAPDGAASNNDLDMVDEMRSAALVHKVHRLNPTVMNARQVVRMATIGGARVLGIDNMVGSIEAGKKADLITISIFGFHMMPIYDPYSHIVYAAKGSDVQTVIVDGKILMEKRELKTLDPQEIAFNAKVLKERILNALG